jgi:hypothetical protein
MQNCVAWLIQTEVSEENLLPLSSGLIKTWRKKTCSFCLTSLPRLPTLTSSSKVLLEKVIVAQRSKISVFYGTKGFIYVFTRTHHRSLSRARWVQSIPRNHISLTHVSILFSHLRLCLPKWCLPCRISNQSFVPISCPPWMLHVPSVLSHFISSP